MTHDSAALSRKFGDAHQRWAHVPVQRGVKSSTQQRNEVEVKGGVLARGQTRCSAFFAEAIAAAEDATSLQSLFQTGKEKRPVLAFQ